MKEIRDVLKRVEKSLFRIQSFVVSNLCSWFMGECSPSLDQFLEWFEFFISYGGVSFLFAALFVYTDGIPLMFLSLDRTDSDRVMCKDIALGSVLLYDILSNIAMKLRVEFLPFNFNQSFLSNVDI